MEEENEVEERIAKNAPGRKGCTRRREENTGKESGDKTALMFQRRQGWFPGILHGRGAGFFVNHSS